MDLLKFPKAKETPLIVFIHIPKTAGTTVNHLLSSSGMAGQDHIQNWLEKKDEAAKIVSSSDWVSGHIGFPGMRAFICSLSPRNLRFYSIMRSPLSQIASHYNWLIEIFKRGGNFYNVLPDRIKEISENIRATDNTRPENVIKQLSLAPGLFLNQQSRVLIGEDVPRLSREEIIDRLSVYEFVATEKFLPELLQKMTNQACNEISRKNQSEYHFDPVVFKSPEMTEFLNSHHRIDMMVYEIISSFGGFYPSPQKVNSASLGQE